MTSLNIPMSQPATSARPNAVDKESPFYVPRVLDRMGRLASRHPRTWLWMGSLETKVLSQQLAAVPLSRPIYVCGLARSGSTLLHEMVCAHARVATHRIKDFPFISTPYWWRRSTRMARPSEARERPHRDRMMITSESPDAVEEMLWMAFFPHCHDPSRDNRLPASPRNTAFDDYYRNHIRKLLLVEQADRYAAKNNYHVARLEYLLALFPDAKFVLPVRSPAAHIASLVRQHAWFSAGHAQSPKALAFMQRSGHFEFGLDRRPIHMGDGERVRAVQDAWRAGEEVRGWACYWDLVYRRLAELLETHEGVRKATLVVRFEDLCDRPAEEIARLLQHCELPDARPVLERFAAAVRRPDYYQSPFSPEELNAISAETAETAKRWGY